MHWAAKIVRAFRPESSESGDTRGGRDRASLEMHLEAMINRIGRCAGSSRWSELRDALGGRD